MSNKRRRNKENPIDKILRMKQQRDEYNRMIERDRTRAIQRALKDASEAQKLHGL